MKSATKPAATESVTRLIQEWTGGNARAGEKLWLSVFAELKLLARRHLARERPDHSLESAALVNEVYARLASGAKPALEGRLHFFAVCAKMMRQILVDHARRRRADKRYGGEQVSLSGITVTRKSQTVDLIALNDALDQLSEKHPRKTQVVELRFFAGLSQDEIASVLGITRATVARDWNFARAWLLATLDGDRSREK
jgi:RNA polymerase sigma factor (TIGR02999 family)